MQKKNPSKTKFKIKHRYTQTQFMAMVVDAAMLSVVPGKGAWWGHSCWSACMLPPPPMPAEEMLKSMFAFHTFFLKMKILFGHFAVSEIRY